MKYYYNESANCYAVTTNFEYEKVPEGFKEITEKKFNEGVNKLKEKGTEEAPEEEK